MALLGFEGFEAYNSIAQMAQQSNYSTGGVLSLTRDATARTGSAYINGNSFDWLLAPTGDVRVVGAGVRLNAGGGAGDSMLGWFCTAASRYALTLGLEAATQLTLRRGGGGGTLLWQSPSGEPTGTWVHLELKFTARSDTTGSWSIQRNGQLIASGSGVQTLVGAGDIPNQLHFRQPTASIDDIYALDGSGTSLNDFLGPVRAHPIRPDANDSVAWSVTGVAANWDAVNDTTPDDDGTYVSAGPTGLPITDRYTMTNLPPEASLVRAVRTLFRARKEDAALVEVRSLVRSGASEAVGTNWALDTQYRYFADYFPTNPATGAAWTPSEVNAIIAGLRRVA